MLVRSVLAAAILLSTCLASRADTTYSVTTNDYSIATPPFNTAESVTGSFTVASPLGDNFSGTVTPVSFSFNDGAATFDTLNEITDFTIDTDASGTITGYDIGLHISASPFFDSLQINAGLADSSFLFNMVSPPLVMTGAGQATGVEWTSSLPPVATPEPSDLVLLGSGVLLLAGVLRRRLA